MSLTTKFLEADSVYYYEIENNKWATISPYEYAKNDVSSTENVPFVNSGQQWLDYFLKNEFLIVEDIHADRQFSANEKKIWKKKGIKSAIAVPLIREGQLCAIFAINCINSRIWKEEELILVKEIAQRTWLAIDRANAQKELKISKEKYYNLFDSIDEGYCILEVLFDPNGKPYDLIFREVNPAFEKNNGLANATGKTILEMVPDIEEKWFKIYGRIAKTGEPLRFKENSKALKRHFDLYAFRVGQEGENLIAVIFTDISKRVLAEEALRQSEERLRVTMKSAIDFVIITLNVEGNIDQWNTGAEQILGYTADEVHGKPFSILFTEEDQEKNIPAKELKTACNKGYTEDGRWHRRKDGSHFFMSGIIRPIYNPKLTGYVIVARDLTGQQQAQEQLRIFEERSRIALESAGMASWDWDVTEDTMICNENYYSLLGIPFEDKKLKTASFVQYVHPDDKELVINYLEHAVETAGEFIAEFRIRRADNGTELWMKGYGSTVSSENNKATRMVGVMFDFTEQKQFTEELSRQVKERTNELERSNDDLRQFAHVASHDLKEPVRKIRTFYNRILEEFSELLPEEVKLYLLRIESAAARMYTMIESVLHYSKLETENETMQKVDLNEIIENIQTDLEVMIENKSAVITKMALPSINAHSTLIYQLFYNLILNSLKFAKANEPSMITIAYSNENDNYFKIQVSDNGIGFRQEQSENIFNTFTRLNSSHLYEGSGLGLALCKKIVERYNGHITASSEPNKGAVFTVLLPKT